MKPLISVVVCTYNRAELLRGCLESLVKQTAERDLFEVIIIDNNSTDTTYAIAREYCARYNFKLVLEVQQGLSHARNRGWKESLGRYVAFIDDDARAYPNWLSEMIAFVERRPDIEIFGGPYDAFTLVHKPNWFPPDYGVLEIGNQERPIVFGREWITGSNMVVSKTALAHCGGFNKDLGMVSGKISYGEETRLLVDLQQCGYSIYYVPSMKVQHLIAEYKLHLNWLLQASYVAGFCSSLSYNKRKSLPIHIFCLFKSCIKMVIKLFSLKNIPLKRRLYYALDSLFYRAGELVSYFRGRTPEI